MSSFLRAFEYLESLPGTTWAKLYKQPSTALAVFRRMLPHLAKSFVMALLYISHPLPVTDLESWVRPDSKRERDIAISALERYHVVSAIANPGKPRAYQLTNTFASSLRLALTGGGSHKSFGVPFDDSNHGKISIEELDEYARRQWEGVLSYMVGSTSINLGDQQIRLSEGVTTLLRRGGLIDIRGRQVEITQEGFAFLLEEVNAQVWAILMLYLESAEAINMEVVDVLSFFFTLGSLELGQSYSKANLTPTQRRMLEDLADYGLVYERSSSQIFYPTRLATTLTSDAGALRSTVSSTFSTATPDNNTNGFVIVETNYRIYAYTSSPLQIAILQLFCRLSARYPNMVAGKITRESIRRAVGMGITSEQIISFLSTHAHPQMRKDNPVLPPTVVDQIRLWQIEGERMKTTPGYLFKEFRDKAEYEDICRYADEVGVLVWKSDARWLFFVTRHEQIASYIRAKKAAEKTK
ncbi:MAG: hypothetical protein Q9191_000524 [Dirinaria sp. TL-2023a]